jgi:redox-sensitive bicupin YhaK (pirin superfamily)
VAATHEDTPDREIILVASARIRPMMGLDTLESLPSPRIPYALVDPFILVDESVVPIIPERASLDTKHPHRGFDNLSYLIADAVRTGLSIGPGGVMKRARLRAGSLLKIRTGRGVWHAEGLPGTRAEGIRWAPAGPRSPKAIEPRRAACYP